MTRKPRRARAVPIQVYVSSAEHQALRRIAKRRDATVAELVRGWIRRATAAAQTREPRPGALGPGFAARICEAYERWRGRVVS